MDIQKLLEEAQKLQKKKTPQQLLAEAQEYIEGRKYGRKGKDGTDADENAITQRVLALVLAQLPKKDELKGEKGDTPTIDYKSIINAVVNQIKPIKGDKGDTPEIDYDLIVSRVTEAIKVPEIDEEQIAITAINLIESFEGDDKLDVLKLKNLDKLLEQVKDFEIDAKKIKGIQDLLPKNPPMYAGGSGATFLKSMRDLDLTGLQDGYGIFWSASKRKFEVREPSEVDNEFDTIELNTTYTPTGTEPVGSTFWEGHGLVTIYENGARLNHGFELYTFGTDEGNNFPEGSAVSVKGASGNRVAFELTDISDNESAINYIGLLTTPVDSGNRLATREGAVNGLKTNYTGTGAWGTTWAEGDQIWVSNTPGGLTNVEPTSGRIIRVGTVTNIHPTQGIIELDRLVLPVAPEIKGVPIFTYFV